MIAILTTAILAGACYGLYSEGAFGERTAFVSLTLLLLGFLAVAVVRVRQVHPQRWVLNPVVWGSFMTFVMSYGATNFLFFIFPDQLDLVGYVPEITASMVKHMGLVLVAALAMWSGYWSPIAKSLTGENRIARFQARLLPRTQHLRRFALPAIVVVATGSRLLQVQLGVFGYSATSYERLIEAGAYTQYLAMGSSLGKASLLLAALVFFSEKPNSRADMAWFYGLIGLEIGWGLLSGFKGQAVTPIIIIAICQYLVTSRFDKKWLVYFAIMYSVAFAIIQPFRSARNADQNFTGTSIEEIVTTMKGAQDLNLQSSSDAVPFALSIASRSNLTWIGSFGLEFADSGLTSADAPKFLENIIMAPLHAWIPRFIWNDKPLSNIGLWYNQVVMGMSHFSSTGMGPVTYLYFAGGGIAVFFGFFLVGCMQRVLFFLLQPWRTIPGACVFFGMASAVTLIDSAFDSMIVSFFRDIPIYLVAMFLIFKSGRGPTSISPVKGAFDGYGGT